MSQIIDYVGLDFLLCILMKEKIESTKALHTAGLVKQ